jgi:hypothetical protein
MNATLRSSAHPATIHWSRIVGGAFLLELALFLVLIPIGIAFTPAGGAMTDSTVFLIAVPTGCFVAGAAVSAWMFRKVAAQRVLHGALLGVIATFIYFAICAVSPGGIPAVIAGYGAFIFWLSQILRICGSIVGAARLSRPQARPAP